MRTAQQTLRADEQVIAETESDPYTHQLISFDGGYAVRSGLEKIGNDDWSRTEYERETDAILHYGIMLRVPDLRRPEANRDQNIPAAVYRIGKEAIAAYLRTGGLSGYTLSWSTVGDRMGVSEATTNNYASDFRNDTRRRIDAAE